MDYCLMGSNPDILDLLKCYYISSFPINKFLDVLPSGDLLVASPLVFVFDVTGFFITNSWINICSSKDYLTYDFFSASFEVIINELFLSSILFKVDLKLMNDSFFLFRSPLFLMLEEDLIMTGFGSPI
jgi:hypothetical protein